MLSMRLSVLSVAARCVRPFSMTTTKSPPPLSVEKDANGIATITMHSMPFNVFNLNLASALYKTLRDLEKENVPGIILTSAYDKVFSAGLDFSMLIKPEYNTFKTWWSELQEVFLALYGSSAPVVAAATGYSAGFGTLLLCASEYRIVQKNYENSSKGIIGYHEVHFGFNPPPWFIKALMNVLPRRVGELAVVQGTLFSPEQALSIGLVDEIATSKEDMISKSKLWLLKSAKINLLPRGITKRIYRDEGLSWMQANKINDVNESFKYISSDQYQSGLTKYMETLKNY